MKMIYVEGTRTFIRPDKITSITIEPLDVLTHSKSQLLIHLANTKPEIINVKDVERAFNLAQELLDLTLLNSYAIIKLGGIIEYCDSFKFGLFINKEIEKYEQKEE